MRQKIDFAIEPLPSLEALENSWQGLDAVGPHSFFLTWTWIGTWLRCLPYPPQTRLLRATRCNETIGLAVFSLKRGNRKGMPIKQAWLNATGDRAYDCVTIEHNGFALSRVEADVVWAAFEDWFSSTASPINEFVLNAVDAGGLPHERSLSDLERIDYGYRAPLADFVTLDGFMSTLSRNSRQQLRRSMRAYERTGPLSIEAARDTQTALAFFAKMKEFHIRSWTRRGRQHAFASPFFETFHRSLICRGVGNGTVDLLRVSAGERTIGYLYNFLNAGTVSSYQGGFDDADGRMRPGYVCHALAITHYAANGMSSYDFLAGKIGLSNPSGQSGTNFAGKGYTNQIPSSAQCHCRAVLLTFFMARTERNWLAHVASGAEFKQDLHQP